MDKSLEMEKWEKRGKFEKTLQEKIKNPDLELSLRELKTPQIYVLYVAYRNKKKLAYAMIA